jgi:hypothetical protein
MTEQEEYVIRQIREGKPADLLERFVLPNVPADEGLKNIDEIGLSGYLTYLKILNENKLIDFLTKYADKLKIRSNFLEKLIIEGFADIKSDRFSFLIANAIITGDLNFSDAEINNSVFLIGCVIDESANFRDAFFKKHLFLNKVSFMKQADFHRLKVGGNLFLKKSEFYDVTDFGGLNIERDFNADEVKFLLSDQKIVFTGMEVGRNVFLSKAVFYGETDFLYSKIGGLFKADGTKFFNTGIAANLNSIKIGRETFFRGAEFYGSTDFGGAIIGGQFSVEDARFYNKEKKINFNNMKIAKSAFFRKTEFKGPVDFGGIEIGGEMGLEEATFMNIAIFNSMMIRGHLYLRESSFLNDVNFVSSYVYGDFNAKFAKFKGANKTLFNSIMIGKNTFFDDSEFFGPVDFMHARFNGLLTIQKAIFQSSKPVNFNNAKVKGSAFFNGSKFNGELDLRFCDFSTLEFVDVNYKNINLEGMTYSDIYAGKDYKNLLTLLDGSPYHAQPYKMLESFLDGQGHKEKADEVFIRGKRRELNQSKWWNPGRMATLIFWDWLAGYGRKPGRTLWVGLVLFGLGIYFFTPPNLREDHWLAQTSFYKAAIAVTLPAENGPGPQATDPTKKDDGPMMTGKSDSSTFLEPGGKVSINGYWDNLALRGIISIDRLLPSWVDLGFARAWEPKEKGISRWTLFYWNFHRVCGWILVVVGLAALGTRFK